MKNKLIILIIFIFVSLALIKILQPQSPKQPQLICNEDLRLSEASKQLNGNQTALGIIKKNCLWLSNSFSADLENNGKKDLVFWAIGAGCTSCHAKYFYILSDKKIILQKELDDPVIETEIVNGANTLVITEPIRKDVELLSSPTSELKTWYLWDKSTETFRVSKKQDQKVGE